MGKEFLDRHIKPQKTAISRLEPQVCDGTIPLKDAQQAIVTDWVAAYRRYVGPL